MSKTSYLVLVLCSLLPASANLVISEFLASNQNGLLDEDGDSSDWIEIHNPGSGEINLSGWTLTDDRSNSTKWSFPDITISPNQYIIAFASGKDRSIPDQQLHTNFKLSSSGEYLALISPSREVVSEYDFPPQESDFSYGIATAGSHVVLISENAQARALVPDQNFDDHIGTNWRTNDPLFDDSTWQAGNLGVGLERSNGFQNEIGIDILNTSWGINASVYLRIPIQADLDPANIESLTLRIKCDDGFAAYLNGHYATGINHPDPLAWNSLATNATPDAQALAFQDFDISASILNLENSQNILAIQGLNQSTISGDMLIRPELVAQLKSPGPSTIGYFSTPTPGEANPGSNTSTPVGAPSGEVSISTPSGVKTSTISVDLSPENEGAEIRYTLDGSDPNTGSPLYTTALEISEPTRLRARAFELEKSPGPIAVADYAFLDPALQSYLSDIPVIVMDNFGSGAYPNKGRSNDGRDIQQVPRQANVMAIYQPSENGLPFSNSPSTESRSGCRVRGSSSSTFSRKPLSVEFWKADDSERKLSPFGFDPEADWVLNPPNPTYDRALIHNPVSFQIGRALGALSPDSKIVAVFQNTNGGLITNSDLAGLYIFSEKIERDRMGVEFEKLSDDGQTGGWMINIDRMSAIPVGMPSNTIQPNFHAAGPNGLLQIPDDQQNSGGSQSADDISEFYHSYLNFHSPGGYQIATTQRSEIQTSIRAMDTAVWSANYQDPASGYRAHLDSESWARFFAVHNLSKNQDAHVLSTYLYRDTPTSKIKMGPVWDFDRAYTWKGGATNTPLWASDRDWYQGLFRDINFRQTLQDIWQEARVTTMTDAILEEFIDDSAEGPNSGQVSRSGLGFTTWQRNVTEMKSYLLSRANYLDNQYESLPSISPETEFFAGDLTVTLSPSAGGTIYYTTDGSDPRLDGGAIAPNAIAYSSPLSFDSRTQIIARTLDGSRWSGPVEKNYYRHDDLPQLVISEIQYHPSDPTSEELEAGFEDSDEFEYLELQNIRSTPVNLESLSISSGIDFDFSSGSMTSLAPASRLLIVRNKPAFEFRYGSDLPVAGEYSGALNNAGDTITLRDTLLDLELLSVTYGDTAPWPECADGDGFSLVLKNPANNPDPTLPSHWRCSSTFAGNPGTSDSRPNFAGDPSADEDRDQRSALVEHFLGTDDLVPYDGLDRIKIGEPIKVDGEFYPTLYVTYLVGADDVTPSAYVSTDLTNWSNNPGEITLIEHTLDGDGNAMLRWRSNTPISIPSQFFRLKVSLLQ
ncbi:MAG: CotH kinase family protein [Akkermansiaceae bacterium]